MISVRSRAAARRRFAGAVGLVSVWAAAELFAHAVPWELVAAAAAVVLFAAAAHALVIGLYLRLIASISATFHLRALWPRLASAGVLITMGATYWQAVASDGPLRQFAVEAVYLLGICVYAARGDVSRELRWRLLRRVGAC